MIQLIGFMIAGYIVTRMVELLVNKETSSLVAIFAGITLLVTLICIFGLFSAGSSISSTLGQMPY